MRLHRKHPSLRPPSGCIPLDPATACGASAPLLRLMLRPGALLRLSVCDQDLGTRWTGPESVEELVRELALTIASAPGANLPPGVGRLSSHDIGGLAERLLQAMLLVLGTPARLPPHSA